MTIDWQATEAEHPARTAARASMDAASRGAKDEWLTLFAPNVILEDPVGPSPFDPEGKGHHGIDGISAFWDMAIAKVERFEFVIVDSFAAGSEVANTGTITSYLPGNMRLDAEGVFTYRVDADGKIVALRAFWELERAMATARPAS